MFRIKDNEKNAFTKDRPLLFLHGYLSNSKSFAYQTTFFSRYFSVHAIDLKGFGDNVGMEYPYSLHDYAREVKEYIDGNFNVAPCVIAHSFGGRIATLLAYKYPNLFDKIVLTGSAGLKPKRSVKFYAKRAVFSLLKTFVRTEKLKKFYSSDYNCLDGTMKRSFVKIVNEHLDYTLPYITRPTLIINGLDDRETPKYTAKRLNKGIKNSKLIFIKNAGHFCFIDAPNKFNMEVREFLLSEN